MDYVHAPRSYDSMSKKEKEGQKVGIISKTFNRLATVEDSTKALAMGGLATANITTLAVLTAGSAIAPITAAWAGICAAGMVAIKAGDLIGEYRERKYLGYTRDEYKQYKEYERERHIENKFGVRAVKPTEKPVPSLR